MSKGEDEEEGDDEPEEEEETAPKIAAEGEENELTAFEVTARVPSHASVLFSCHLFLHTLESFVNRIGRSAMCIHSPAP